MYAEWSGPVHGTFGRVCLVTALVVLLSACSDDDDTAGADATSTLPIDGTVTTTASSTAAATQTETGITATATPASESTEVVSPTAGATPSEAAGAELEYEQQATWDAAWERLGAIVFGPEGRLYIDDYVQDQLLVFAMDGSELESLAYTTEHPQMVEARSDLAVGPDGRLYLLEQAGGTWVKVLEPDGTPVQEWGGTVGFDDESLFDARTIAVAPDGHIFTVRAGQLLQKFTSDGEFIAAWDPAGENLFPTEVYDIEVTDDTLYLAGSGYRDDQSVILTFDLEGNLVAEPLVVGVADAKDRIVPWSLAIGPVGNLFIADVVAREVVVLTPTGDELARWSLEPTEERFPTVEIAVDPDGRVYLADDAHKTIYVYAPQQAP
jgi:hypothetical protein